MDYWKFLRKYPKLLNHLKDQLPQILQKEKLQILDVEIFSKQYKPIKPRVEWQDAVQQDVRESATVIESLHRAQAASLETKVRLLNPDLTEEEVSEEVLKVATNYNLADQSVEDVLELP